MNAHERKTDGREGHGRTAEEVREYLVTRFDAALRRTGMFGGEISLRLLGDALAFADDCERHWAEDLRSLRAEGALLPTGVRGAFDHLWGSGSVDMTASVYAQVAHSRGWLRLDRTLSRAEYDELLRAGESWCRQDRTLGRTLAVFGPPSIRFGGDNPYYPKTLAYTTGHGADPLVCFHFWNEFLPSDTGLRGRYDEPVLLAIRSRGPDFIGGFRFTPVGAARRRNHPSRGENG